MGRAEKYREEARRCDLLLDQVQDLRVRQQLRRERQEWLELAASLDTTRTAAYDPERLDQDMTLASLRAFEATQRN
jgi:hypothetical protein